MRQLMRELHDPTVNRFTAVAHALWRWRHLIGYVILAVAVAYTFALERQHFNESRTRVAEQTHVTLIQQCVRGNDLRHTLRQLVASTQPPHSAVDHGDITEQQYRQGLKFQRRSHHALRSIDCARAYPPLDVAVH